MAIPINVFLDTNVFIKEQYNISNESPLGIIKKLSNEGRIKVYIDTVIYNEVMIHLEKDILSFIDKLNTAVRSLNKGLTTNFINGTQIGHLYETIETVTKIELMNNMENYFRLADYNILDNEYVSVDQLLHDYFNSKPPFENKEKKKHEFPDAIVAQKIRKIFNSDKPIYVVSSDNGFIASLQECDGIKVVGNLKSFLDIVSKTEKSLYECLQFKLLSLADTDDLSNLIKENILSSRLSIQGLDCDRKGLCEGHEYDETDVLSVDLDDVKLKTINNIMGDTINATFLCKATIRIWGKFQDYDQSIYDSEDKEYYNVKEVEVEETHEVEFDYDIEFEYTLNNDEFKYEKLNEFFDFTLDQDTRTEREYLTDDDDEYYPEDYI